MVLSTHRMVKVFGALTLLSFGVAYVFYAHWLVSVWCYFSAVLSVAVLLHFRLDEDPSKARAPLARGL
jgi:hypothetical protein